MLQSREWKVDYKALAYYHQCQQILLVTGRENCDFILHAANGPDSVQRIPRDEPLIEKILTYLTACVLLPLRSLKCASPGISCCLCYLHLDRLTVDWILKTLPHVLLRHHRMTPWNLLCPLNLHHLLMSQILPRLQQKPQHLIYQHPPMIPINSLFLLTACIPKRKSMLQKLFLHSLVQPVTLFLLVTQTRN